MVVVVPALAECQQGHQEVVAAAVSGRVGPRAPQVADRIHHERGVPQGDGADEESPHEHLQSAGSQARVEPVQQRAQAEQGSGLAQDQENVAFL